MSRRFQRTLLMEEEHHFSPNALLSPTRKLNPSCWVVASDISAFEDLIDTSAGEAYNAFSFSFSFSFFNVKKETNNVEKMTTFI
uniref:Uncharacterized protein n=1 Tax=Noccaea caerulescens TaxID=107243 RepID=A0A1J3F293_NOCCA